MNSSGLRPRLAALITTVIACGYLLSLSSATAWAKVGTITEFPVTTSSSQPEGITAGPDGNLWFTEGLGNKIGRITTSGVFTEFPLAPPGSPNSQPLGITAGPDGKLWFTERLGDKIGHITPKQGKITEFPTPTTGSEPAGITAGPANTTNVWFTESLSNKIGEITTK